MEQKQSIKFLRFTEYYDMQEEFDNLYRKSVHNEIFYSLTDLIIKRENILLAYRTIKRNKGSFTSGVDKLNIEDIEKYTADEVIQKVRNYLVYSEHGYRPKPVKRVEIPKPNGKTRPLGIPCIWDRLIQQAIKQILEPICEAKFSKNSFGFRPDTSVENALGSFYKLLQKQKCHYIVELDIKSFFDNVNHSKLIKQLWTMGIRDKKLLNILRRILKAKIRMPDGTTITPNKGTPQGGIISPLLANIYLNEFDKWIDSQWQENPISHKYAVDRTSQGKGIDKGGAYIRMRRTKLKEVYLIRYADDIRLFTKTYNEAYRIKCASEMWLGQRLKLNLSQEKTRIVHTEHKFSEFLGFKIRLRNKGNKLVVESHMCDKAYENERNKLLKQLQQMVKPTNPNRTIYDEVKLYNSMVLGIQEYYKFATDIQIDLDKINWNIMNRLKNRTTKEKGGRLKKTGRELSDFEKRRFGKSKMIRYLAGTDKIEPIYPLSYLRTKYPMCKSNSKNRFTEKGREQLHEELQLNKKVMRDLIIDSSYDRSIELMDNRISLFSAQKGKCAVTGEMFANIKMIHCHHIIPRKNGGTDNYKNLILILPEVHLLVHAVNEETISKYLKAMNLTKTEIEKLNKLREACGNTPIKIVTSSTI